MHAESGLCLTTEGWMVSVTPCLEKDPRQVWIIQTFEEYKEKLANKMNPIDPSNP